MSSDAFRSPLVLPLCEAALSLTPRTPQEKNAEVEKLKRQNAALVAQHTQELQIHQVPEFSQCVAVA